MYRTILLLSDGTQLVSGAGTKNAIRAVSFTECVNDDKELSVGSVCAKMAEITVIAPNGGFGISEGDTFTMVQEDTDGQRCTIGQFIAQKPVRTSSNLLKITAYDPVIRLDRDLTDWLAGLGQWPYTLSAFAQMVCQACGVSLRTAGLDNAQYPVQRFSAHGVTGRQLMRWIGQIGGCFCRAATDGVLEFAWYTPSEVTIGALRGGKLQAVYDGTQTLMLNGHTLSMRHSGSSLWMQQEQLAVENREEALQLTLPEAQRLAYYQNKLSYSDYQVAPIEKVQLKATADDIGTIYPPELAQQVNTYVITGNPMLSARSGEDLAEVAKKLYEKLQLPAYTPCRLTVPMDQRIRAGTIITVTDGNGVTIQTLVMTRRRSGQRDTLECTGSASRTSSSAVNNQSYQALSGKVMELRTDADGLRLQNQDLQGAVAALSVSVQSIDSTVKAQTQSVEQRLTQLQQTADGLRLSVQGIQENGASQVVTKTGFTFDQKGLHICKTESDMENLLDESGMYVRRNGQVILQANDDGVQAVDVTVGNYLMVGSHARFEDYTDPADGKRTACYWL